MNEIGMFSLAVNNPHIPKNHIHSQTNLVDRLAGFFEKSIKGVSDFTSQNSKVDFIPKECEVLGTLSFQP